MRATSVGRDALPLHRGVVVWRTLAISTATRSGAVRSAGWPSAACAAATAAELEALRSTYDIADRVTLEARVLDDDFRPSEAANREIVLEDPDGEERPLELAGQRPPRPVPRHLPARRPARGPDPRGRPGPENDVTAEFDVQLLARAPTRARPRGHGAPRGSAAASPPRPAASTPSWSRPSRPIRSVANPYPASSRRLGPLGDPRPRPAPARRRVSCASRPARLARRAPSPALVSAPPLGLPSRPHFTHRSPRGTAPCSTAATQHRSRRRPRGPSRADGRDVCRAADGAVGLHGGSLGGCAGRRGPNANLFQLYDTRAARSRARRRSTSRPRAGPRRSPGSRR